MVVGGKSGLLQACLQDVFPTGVREKLRLAARKIDARRRQRQVLRNLDDRQSGASRKRLVQPAVGIGQPEGAGQDSPAGPCRPGASIPRRGQAARQTRLPWSSSLCPLSDLQWP